MCGWMHDMKKMIMILDKVMIANAYRITGLGLI